VTQSFLWDFCQPFLRFCPGDIVTQSFFKVCQTFLRFYQPFFWFRSLIHRVCSVTCVFELFLRFCEPFFCDFGTDSVTRWVHVQYGLVDFFSVRHPRRLGTASVQNNRNEFPPSSGHVLWGHTNIRVEHSYFFSWAVCFSEMCTSWAELVVLLAGIGRSWREFMSALGTRESGGSRGEGAWGPNAGGSRHGTGAGVCGAWDWRGRKTGLVGGAGDGR
jgi:hypothetical protein